MLLEIGKYKTSRFNFLEKSILILNKNKSDDGFLITTVDDVNLDHAGICFVPEPYGKSALSMSADGSDFAKWIKVEQPSIQISLQPSTSKHSLHGADIWLPLMFLASDVTMPFFLNLISSYVYEKTRGKLSQDHPKVHFSAIYKNHQDGVSKRINFSGDSESLKELMKRFDTENFFDEKS